MSITYWTRFSKIGYKMAKIKTITGLTLFLWVEVATFQRMSAHYMAEYLTANFLLCFIAFWYAWEIVEA